MTHGTKYGYDQGCRCFWCREAQRIARHLARDKARAANSPAYQHELAVSRALKERYRGTCQQCGGPTAPPKGTTSTGLCQGCYNEQRAAQHGNRSRYTAGCRCDDCRRANRDVQREYVARKTGA